MLWRKAGGNTENVRESVMMHHRNARPTQAFCCPSRASCPAFVLNTSPLPSTAPTEDRRGGHGRTPHINTHPFSRNTSKRYCSCKPPAPYHALATALAQGALASRTDPNTLPVSLLVVLTLARIGAQARHAERCNGAASRVGFRNETAPGIGFSTNHFTRPASPRPAAVLPCGAPC